MAKAARARLARLAFLITWPLLAGSAPGSEPSRLDAEIARPWRGDLDGMVARRTIRMLVVNSKTFYFVDKGQQRGLSHDLGRAFEEEVNRSLGKKVMRVNVVFLPVSSEDLLPALLEGRGDLANANLTITPERRQFVDFSEPLWTGIDEVVVTGPASPPIASADVSPARRSSSALPAATSRASGT